MGERSMGFWKPTIGYALILLVGISVAVGIHFDIKNDYRLARARYIDNSRADTKAAARHVEVAFRSSTRTCERSASCRA
ncbi:MAG: hypothetical protein ABWZ57_01005 [Mesorhizobium sp.]